MRAAPYHADVAAGPPGRAVWADADGVDVRVALWPLEGARATALIFPGRTEHCEKYGPLAADLRGAGLAAAAIDWRGQGLTVRPRRNRRSGHVGDFAEFQADVDAMVATARAAGLPEPFHLVAHSMGGLIGLRALMRGAPLARAAFSAPMWGLPLPAPRRAAAWGLSWLGAKLGLGEAATPFSGKSAEPAAMPFEGNLLTTDRDTFAWIKRHHATHPDLTLGPPSLAWLGAALREMDEVAALPMLARGAALRFLLTRLWDWLHIPDGGLVKKKDPLEYLARMRHHAIVRTPADLGWDEAIRERGWEGRA